MSLNNIELPEFIIGEWYKDALLPLPAEHLLPAIPRPTSASPASASSAPASPSSPSPASPSPTSASPASASPAPTPAATTPHPPVTPAPIPPAASSSPEAPPSPDAPPSPEAPHKFLGSNRRNVTLIVNAPGAPFLPDNQLAFLTKILEACHMTLADVAIVNHAAAAVSIGAVKQQLQPRAILLFGLEPTDIRLPINFPHFKQLSYDDCTYLSSPALSLMVPNTNESRLLKSKLWVCLKTLFDV